MTAAELNADAEVPIEQQRFSIRIVDDPVVIAAELRIVARDELQTRQRPLSKFFDQVAIAEFAVNFPMGCDRAEINHPNVPPRVGGRGEGKWGRRHE